MNLEVLTSMRDTLDKTAARLAKYFRISRFDTSTNGDLNTAQKTCEAVAENVLNWIEEENEEKILHLPKDRIKEIFDDRKSIPMERAQSLEELFQKDGKFGPRALVERQTTEVQALPVVVVRNNKGDVLRLRRKESSSKNALHEKIVIWAGGHVRREDSAEHSALRAGAVRELEEELRLRIEQSELNLIGAVYANLNEGTSKHVAIVYEWIAKTPEVQVALSASEFFERQGNSLSGTFESPQNLIKQINNGELLEEWSSMIIKNLLIDTREQTNKDLFDQRQ